MMWSGSAKKKKYKEFEMEQDNVWLRNNRLVVEGVVSGHVKSDAMVCSLSVGGPKIWYLAFTCDSWSSYEADGLAELLLRLFDIRVTASYVSLSQMRDSASWLRVQIFIE